MTSDPCSEILKNLHRVLEEDTPENLCATIRAHLETCPSCRRQREALEELILLCKRFPEEEMQAEQKKRMKSELKRILFSQGKQRRRTNAA